MRIWALCDDRAGHTAHTLGVAAMLGQPYERVKLTTNAISSLPNRLLGASLAGYSAPSRALLHAPFPDIAIATGRRLVPAMRYLRQHAPQIKLVQCLWPSSCDPFDLVLAPTHDDPPDDARLLRFQGALHAVDDAALQDARITFQALFDRFPKPHLGVLIGGHSPHGRATLAQLHHLIDCAELMVQGGSLFITTSRRTPAAFADAVEDRLTCPYHLHRYGDSGLNPYRALLACCDGLIVSGDSISMISECCITGKPVLVDDGFASLGRKHHQFIRQMEQSGHVMRLRADVNWQEFQPVVLNEAARLAPLIKDHLSLASGFAST